MEASNVAPPPLKPNRPVLLRSLPALIRRSRFARCVLPIIAGVVILASFMATITAEYTSVSVASSTLIRTMQHPGQLNRKIPGKNLGGGRFRLLASSVIDIYTSNRENPSTPSLVSFVDRTSSSRKESQRRRRWIVPNVYIGDLEEEDDFEDEEDDSLFALSKLTETQALDVLTKQSSLEAIDELARSDGGSGGLLCVAAIKGYKRIIDLLVEMGANVNYRKDDFSLTPLAHAVVKGHADCAVALIDHGARVTMVGIDPRYMVTFAIQSGDTGLFHRLVTEGINIHEPYSFSDFEKRTQLDVAVDIGQEGFAELLLDLGLDPYAGRGYVWLTNRARELGLDNVVSKLETYNRGQNASLELPVAPSLRKAVPLPNEDVIHDVEEDPETMAKEERLKWEKVADQFYEKWRNGEGGYQMELLNEEDFEDDEFDTAVRPFWQTAKTEDILWNPPKEEEPDDEAALEYYTREGGGGGGRSTRAWGYNDNDYDDDVASFDLDSAMATRPPGGFIRTPDTTVVDARKRASSSSSSSRSTTSAGIYRTPEVRRSLKVLGMDPDEEFDQEDVDAQFRIMVERAIDDEDRQERLHIARDFLIGKLMNI